MIVRLVYVCASPTTFAKIRDIQVMVIQGPRTDANGLRKYRCGESRPTTCAT